MDGVSMFSELIEGLSSGSSNWIASGVTSWAAFGAVVLAAVAAGCCAASFRSRMAERRRRAIMLDLALDGGTSGPSVLLRRGIGPLMGISTALLRIKAIAGVVQDAEAVLLRRGIESREEALLSVMVAGSGIVAVAAGIIGKSPIAAVLAALLLWVIAAMWARAGRERLVAEVRDEVPNVLQSIEASFLSGMTLQQTFQQAAQDSDGFIRTRMLHCVHVMETGGSAADALVALRRDTVIPEMTFLAVALDVQHQTGGSMKQVLEAVQEVTRSKLELARELRVQTAQAALSARVVTALPFVLMAIFSLMSPGFLMPFFVSIPGVAIFILACGMEAAGILMVRRMLKAGESE